MKPQLKSLFLQFLAFGEYKLGVAFCPSLTAFSSWGKKKKNKEICVRAAQSCNVRHRVIFFPHYCEKSVSNDLMGLHAIYDQLQGVLNFNMLYTNNMP